MIPLSSLPEKMQSSDAEWGDKFWKLLKFMPKRERERFFASE
jgi:hypothetical protein